MKLSTKSRYALEALLYMALHAYDHPVSTGEISKETGISEGYLDQIFFRLRKAGLLTAVRGKAGGFLLASSPEETSAGSVVRALEGTLVPVACAEDLSACKSLVRDQCVTRALWVRLSREIGNILDGMTLASLAEAFREKEGAL
ncbi:RrF2 family transcriptional regulator [Christensenella tenuis]|jgi:Rrf2 family protein|uniref:Rrf2 family transcriptional regulator n=1 Tax=Christensenella tenuis TaxID=2763033 RepID=A0ABR7EIL4_9FIRM|nr:Rrf2 family transcriptional regulator [Christensenella tenuis]MBC5649523.1 Rrf2 family transcriptional regulator [Christensenella tenuis]